MYEDLPDDTVVCHWEAVAGGDGRPNVRSAASLEWSDLLEVKALTRAGMGICQARDCARAVEMLYQAKSGRDVRDSGFTPRMPIRPLSIHSFEKP